MTSKLGLIVRDAYQMDETFINAPEKIVETPYGLVTVKTTDKWTMICRSGLDQANYSLPHEYNTVAHLSAFKILGLSEIIGVHSTGSLRPSLAPGTLVIPDDWINFFSASTTISGQRCHLTPSFSRLVRQNLADAAWKAQVKFENGGTYWQTAGPRLETRAEIKVMSNFADLVGMGLANEASLAQEIGLQYGAICSVDNYANGLGAPNLTDNIICEQSAKSALILARVLSQY